MGKMIRILIAIIVVLSFVMLGRNNAAWAANPGADSSPNAQQPLSPEGSKRCNNDDKDEARDCEDDRGEHDDEDDDGDGDDDNDGTVKPPRRRAKICKPGSVSIGGQATVEVKQIGRGGCVTAFTTAYNPKSDPPLPQGTRALSDVLSVKLPKKNALVKICFAAPPGGSASIYTISSRTWQAVGSSSTGKVCTETSKSGTYILLRT
jgi:hypothetical protein